MRVSVLAITRNGLAVGRRLGGLYPGWDVLAPAKLDDGGGGVSWYAEPTPQKTVELFGGSDALVCVFSLGAVIRLIAPHLGDKKTDPAVIVIDDRAGFVISALSGHIGGANGLAAEIAEGLGAQAVITTAADVNRTIAVDMVGRDMGWRIEDGSAVTATSARMVNGEPVGVFQDAGGAGWYDRLPANVTIYNTMEELAAADPAGRMIISDRTVDAPPDSVTYRPPSLVVGIGLHRDTARDTILAGIAECLKRFGLSPLSVCKLASIKKPSDVPGLAEAAGELGVPVEYVDRADLARVEAPNPSDTVRAFEGTASVSEAAAILVSGGPLAVEKQKFPPDLTVAIARIVG